MTGAIKGAEATRVVAYLRVSTEQQADRGVSLEAQRSKAKAYADLYDLEIVEIVEDAGFSAKTLDRPGLVRVMAMLEVGEADGVLVVKLDRLTRSVRDLGALLDRYFVDGGKVLLSVSEQIDTRTAAGRLVLNILSSISQWEREVIGERTREALVYLREQGVRLGGEALGWARQDDQDENGRRIVGEVRQEAETVARILELREQGLTLRAIGETLTREVRKTKRGGKWHPGTVRAVLKREQGVR